MSIEIIKSPLFSNRKIQYCAIIRRGDAEVCGEWADTEEEARQELLDFITYCSIEVELIESEGE